MSMALMNSEIETADPNCFEIKRIGESVYPSIGAKISLPVRGILPMDKEVAV